MKTRMTMMTLAAFALAAAFGAQAQSGEMSAPQKVDEGAVKSAKPAPSTVDRKALQKEAAAARKSGATSEGECGPEQKADAGACKKPPVQAGKTRDEVKKEAVAAVKSGKTPGGEKP